MPGTVDESKNDHVSDILQWYPTHEQTSVDLRAKKKTKNFSFISSVLTLEAI